MKLFKHFKTKQQLRKEVVELRSMLSHQKPRLHTIEREVQKISSDMTFDNEKSIEYIKEQIAYNMIEFLNPLIEWDIEDDKTNPLKKKMRGSLYLAQRK